MHALAASGATRSASPSTRTTPAPQHTRRCRRVAHATRAAGTAAAVLAAILVTCGINRPAVKLAWADGIDLAPGVSVTPAAGWTIEDQGRGWVMLHNAFATAELEIKIKSASGTDPVAILQGDITNLSALSTTGLTNVRDLGAPTTQPLQSGNFQQQATIGYSADGTSRMGLIPVVGWFMELLNTTNHQSAFIVFAQNGDAPARADDEAGAIINSML